MHYVAKKVKHIGLDHKRDGRNCQDAVAIREGKKWIVGVVCDGSGGGSDEAGGGHGECSETGALRSADYLAARTLTAFEDADKEEFVSITDLSIEIYADYQKNLIVQLQAAFIGVNATDAEKRKWVETHLMHTALIIVADRKRGPMWFLYKGDGFQVAQNGQTIELRAHLDSNGGVIYPALALPTHEDERAEIPFRIVSLGLHGGKGVAITTDGLRFVKPDKVDELLFGGDDDPYFLENNIQFAIEDGWLKLGDDFAAVTIEQAED